MPISRRLTIEMRLKAASLLLPVAQYQETKQNLTPEENDSLHYTEEGHIKGSGDPYRIVIMGDSGYTGIGTDNKDSKFSSQLARQLHYMNRRPVEWFSYGEPQLKSNQLNSSLNNIDQGKITEANLIVITIGIGDALNFSSREEWSNGILKAIKAIKMANSSVPILFTGIPPMASMPVLPSPLSWLLGLKAEQLNEQLKSTLSEVPQAHFISDTMAPFPALFANESLQPSENGFFEWAHYLVIKGRPFIYTPSARKPNSYVTNLNEKPEPKPVQKPTQEKTHTHFSAKFKAKLAIEALKEKRSLSELSNIYHVPIELISSWKKSILSYSEQAFEENSPEKKRASLRSSEKNGEMRKLSMVNGY